MSIEKCQKCKEPFQVGEHNLPMPDTKEREPITCPYCGHTIERITNGWWNVSALTDEQKRKFLENE